MTVVQYVLVALLWNSGHLVVGKFETLEACQKAEVILDESIVNASICLPDFGVQT